MGDVLSDREKQRKEGFTVLFKRRLKHNTSKKRNLNKNMEL